MTDALSQSPGARLRAAREKQGLHIAALAAAIKVAPRKLDALENDRWDELPDATFTRALAQTVCRTLKVDARPILELLPAVSTVAFEASGGGLNAPFQDRPGRDEPGLAGVAIRPMIWAASLLMVAAVVVYFMPEGLFDAAVPALVQAPASAPAAQVPSPAASVAITAAPVVAAASAPPAAASEAAPVTQPTVETVFAAPAAASAAPAGLVQLRTNDASWIEARDSRGQILLSRTVLPGESVGLDGNLPIRLTIGNASATQLGFRGQAVDLASRTRDNVARVELQ